MKTMTNFPLRFVSLILVSIAFFGITSCDKNNDNSTSGMYTVSGNSSGSQVVPSVSGSATGTITGSYNSNTNLLSYTMAWTGLTGAATSASFYTGVSGTNGTLLENATITTSGSTGASVGTVTLSDAQEQALLNGTMYYVVGTSAHASGEIRGQITATPQ